MTEEIAVTCSRDIRDRENYTDSITTVTVGTSDSRTIETIEVLYNCHSPYTIFLILITIVNIGNSGCGFSSDLYPIYLEYSVNGTSYLLKQFR